MEEIRARQRKEQRDLQSRITQKKKNATKKTRKGVNDECERLEREMKDRHETEIAELDPSAHDVEFSSLSIDDNHSGVTNALTERNGDDTVVPTLTEHSNSPLPSTSLRRDDSLPTEAKVKKPNRQKARLERRAAEQQAQAEAAAEEAALLPNRREQEISAMQSEMTKRGLVETQVRPDGHCMYSACALTLPADGIGTFQTIRTAAAEFISAHADDFGPFLEEPVSTYVTKVKDTAEWGGHLELQAIAKAFSVTINVLQATGHVEQILPSAQTRQEIWLAYYRHSFGLGEHYNALMKSSEG